MLKICWITNVPSPYKMELISRLGKSFKITVIFERDRELGRNSSWFSRKFDNLEVVYLKGFLSAKSIIDKYSKECDLLINGDYSNIVCIYAVHKFKKIGKPTILQADGGLAINRGIIDCFISFFMRKNDYFLSSGIETNLYYRYYGVDENKIFNYKFSSLTKEDLKSNKELVKSKISLRKKHNINDSIIILSVGQQIKRKGYDILMKSMASLNRNIKLYIVGGEPQREVLKIIEDQHLVNVHFIGFKSKEELNEFYAMSDIFVFPTRYDIWGLVINEAMSFGLPIISSDKCVAALEFNQQFGNVKLFKSENFIELAQCIKLLVDNKALRLKLGKRSIKAIQEYSIENAVLDFTKIINNFVLKCRSDN